MLYIEQIIAKRLLDIYSMLLHNMLHLNIFSSRESQKRKQMPYNHRKKNLDYLEIFKHILPYEIRFYIIFNCDQKKLE